MVSVENPELSNGPLHLDIPFEKSVVVSRFGAKSVVARGEAKGLEEERGVAALRAALK